jgi:drug/metabolite transporter (DMT)-like permease
MNKGVAYALFAAAAFGASTPFAKTLVSHVAPVMLAGLLYMGSGLGLLSWFIVHSSWTEGRKDTSARLTRRDMPWMAGAIFFGGMCGPVLLMLGLTTTPSSSTSLLLNLEGVLTALLAWFAFKENFDRRIFIGMVFIVTGGLLLSWDQPGEIGVSWSTLAIAGACLCWAIDNNLTRKISARDAVQIAGIKGLVAGSVNLGIGIALGFATPSLPDILVAGLVGFIGYGLSLVLFVLALRNLGTARTGAYFSVGPFIGAAISVVVFGETPRAEFWAAAMLMGAGIWLHLTEYHSHSHSHAELRHAHRHSHDEHHQHDHELPWDGREPHVHQHRHEPMTHTHPHVPDIHHHDH